MLPNGTMMIPLCGKMDATLDWKDAFDQAEASENVMLDLDLGLFDGLKFPLTHEMQFRSLTLAIEQLNECVEPIVEKCRGVIITHGKGMKDLFREKGDFIGLLLPFFREELKVHVHLDFSIEAILHPSLQECQLIFRGAPKLYDPNAESAILVPKDGNVSDLMMKVEEIAVPYRLISEEFLVSQWQGLETLYVAEDLVTADTKRAILGFKAAEGVVKSFENLSLSC